MKTLNIAVAGLGTVGVGVIKLLAENAELITARTGAQIKVVAVSSRDKTKDRGMDLSPYIWYGDAKDMAENGDYDILLETVGGVHGIALDIVTIALNKGRHVVTANKAMLAHHGQALAELSESQGVCLGYEAAVAGGIPVIKAVRESLAGNEITSIRGILNGTCNYILTTMREENRSFADVLEDAQKLGYAEADPTADVEGIDAAHKLALLASLGFGTKVNFDGVHIEGISNLQNIDQVAADALGYSIKLLGITRNLGKEILQRVTPVLLPKHDSMYGVEGVFNAVSIHSDAADETFLVGRGAGEKPTASAVVSDICDIAKGFVSPVFGASASSLKNVPAQDASTYVAPRYIRMRLQSDKTVDVRETLSKYGITLEKAWQSKNPDGSYWTIVLTNRVAEAVVTDMLQDLAGLDEVVDTPYAMPIENQV